MRSEISFLVAAAVFHIAGIGVAGTVARRFARADQRMMQPIQAIDIEVGPPLTLPAANIAPPGKIDDTPKPERPEDKPPPAAAAVAPASGPVGPGRPGPGPGPEGTVNPAPGPAPAPSGEYAGPAGPMGPGGGVLNGPPGLSGPIWAMPGILPSAAPPPPAPTVAPAPREVDKDIAGKLIRQALNEKDKKIGLDSPAAGTVASTLRDAVQSSDTPGDSRASFEIRINAAGQVVGIKVLRSNTGDPAMWARIAQAASARLAGRGLVLSGDYAKGAVVTVDVVSTIQAPSGGNGSPKLQGAGVGFDISDIGAHKRRVVRVSHRVVPMK